MILKKNKIAIFTNPFDTVNISLAEKYLYFCTDRIFLIPYLLEISLVVGETFKLKCLGRILHKTYSYAIYIACVVR